MKRTLLLKALATAVPLALLVLSHQTFGWVSVLSLSLAMLVLVGLILFRLITGIGSGRWTEAGANRALLSTTIALTILALLVASVVVRGDFYRRHSHREENVAFHPELGHAPVADPALREAGLDLAVTVGQHLEVLDPGRSQVVVMGDSVLYGWGVARAENSVSRLDDLLPGYQVVNYSVSGYSIDQYYLYLRKHLPRAKAQALVVGVYAGNDYESVGMSHWSGHSTPVFELRDGQLSLFRPHTPGFNCIDVLSGSLLFKPLWLFPRFAMGLEELVCNVRTLSEPEHGEVVARLLEAIAHVAKAQSTRLLYVLLPDRNDFDRQGWYYREKSKYDALARLLKDGGYDVLWFRDSIEASGVDPRTLYLPDDAAHFNAAGHRLLADELHRELGERYGVR